MRLSLHRDISTPLRRSHAAVPCDKATSSVSDMVETVKQLPLDDNTDTTWLTQWQHVISTHSTKAKERVADFLCTKRLTAFLYQYGQVRQGRIALPRARCCSPGDHTMRCLQPVH